MGMDIKTIQEDIHQTAVDHGWWVEERNFGEVIALIHSELSEALEEWRHSKPNLYYAGPEPCGVGVELADAVIRILDAATGFGVDIEECLRVKMEYNKMRKYRHGGLRT